MGESYMVITLHSNERRSKFMFLYLISIRLLDTYINKTVHVTDSVFTICMSGNEASTSLSLGRN